MTKYKHIVHCECDNCIELEDVDPKVLHLFMCDNCYKEHMLFGHRLVEWVTDENKDKKMVHGVIHLNGKGNNEV